MRGLAYCDDAILKVRIHFHNITQSNVNHCKKIQLWHVFQSHFMEWQLNFLSVYKMETGLARLSCKSSAFIRANKGTSLCLDYGLMVRKFKPHSFDFLINVVSYYSFMGEQRFLKWVQERDSKECSSLACYTEFTSLGLRLEIPPNQI